MNAIEQHFKIADRYELFTGHKSARNLYLYQKLGYREFKRISVNETLVCWCFWRNIGIITNRDSSYNATDVLVFSKSSAASH